MDNSNLQNVPTKQKIELVFKLWDEIAESNEPVVLSDSVKAELDRRCAELDTAPSSAITEDEMWRRVNQKRNRNDGS